MSKKIFPSINDGLPVLPDDILLKFVPFEAGRMLGHNKTQPKDSEQTLDVDEPVPTSYLNTKTHQLVASQYGGDGGSMYGRGREVGAIGRADEVDGGSTAGLLTDQKSKLDNTRVTGRVDVVWHSGSPKNIDGALSRFESHLHLDDVEWTVDVLAEKSGRDVDVVDFIRDEWVGVEMENQGQGQSQQHFTLKSDIVLPEPQLQLPHLLNRNQSSVEEMPCSNSPPDSEHDRYLFPLINYPLNQDPTSAYRMREIEMGKRNLREEKAELIYSLQKRQIQEILKQRGHAQGTKAPPPKIQPTVEEDFDPELLLRRLEKTETSLESLRAEYEKSKVNCDPESFQPQFEMVELDRVLVGLEEDDQVDIVQKIQDLESKLEEFKILLSHDHKSAALNQTRIEVELPTYTPDSEGDVVFQGFAEKLKLTVGVGSTMEASIDDAVRNLYKKFYGP